MQSNIFLFLMHQISHDNNADIKYSPEYFIQENNIFNMFPVKRQHHKKSILTNCI